MRMTAPRRRLFIEHLVSLDAVCGKNLSRGKRCLLVPAHEGRCSARGVKHEKTEVEVLKHKLAKARTRAYVRQRQREHVTRLLQEAQAKIARMESQPGYRINYKIVGGWHRCKRWRWQLGWALRRRTLSGWRW